MRFSTLTSLLLSEVFYVWFPAVLVVKGGLTLWSLLRTTPV
jgi:hypothetical protein